MMKQAFVRGGRKALWPAIIFSLLILPGCWYYSFTGATIASHIRSISIPLVEDLSMSGRAELSEELTELLVNRFVRQTRLNLERNEDIADVVLVTRIDRYTNEPAAVGAQERATLNRVSITVTATYFDRVENRELLNRQFSSFAEFDPVADGLDGEFVAAGVALDNISNDIFNAATSDW